MVQEDEWGQVLGWGLHHAQQGSHKVQYTPLFFNMHMDDIDDAHPIFNKLRDQVRVHANLQTTVQC